MAQTKRKRKRKHKGTRAAASTAGGAHRGPQITRPAPIRVARWRCAAHATDLAQLGPPPTDRGRNLLTPPHVAVHARGELAGAATFMLVLYIPTGYYIDRFFYTRRQASKRKAKAAKGS